MDIDENQQEQEIGIAQAQIESVPEESKNQSISPGPSRIPRYNRISNSLASAPSTSTIRLNSTTSLTLLNRKYHLLLIIENEIAFLATYLRLQRFHLPI